jgi:hypothetical protein
MRDFSPVIFLKDVRMESPQEVIHQSLETAVDIYHLLEDVCLLEDNIKELIYWIDQILCIV